MPGHLDVADLLHLEDPAGGDPGEGAGRVEPEVGIRLGSHTWCKPAGGPDYSRHPMPSICFSSATTRVAGCAHAWNQPHPGRGRHPRRPPGRHVVLHRPGPHDRRHDASARPPRSASPAPSPAPRPSPTSSTRRSTRSPSTATAIDPATAYADSRITLTGLAADNELVVRADCPTRAPARACTASSTRSTTASTSTRSSRCRTPAACSPPSSSPTSRRRSRSHVTAPDHWKVVSNSPTPEPQEPSARAASRLAVRAHQADVDVHHRARRRRVPRGPARLRRQARRHPARPLLPPVAGRAPRRRRAGRAHQAGLRVLRGAPSTTPTRSASTTSSTCRSTTWARWRTPAA